MLGKQINRDRKKTATILNLLLYIINMFSVTKDTVVYGPVVWKPTNAKFWIQNLNPRTYEQSHTPTVVQGGGWWTPPPGFCYVTIFQKDFTFSRKPVMCSTKWGLYYGCHAAGGLWRHPRWPPFWAQSWILPKIRNGQKTLKIGTFDAGHVEYDIIKHFAAFCWHFLHFAPKKGKIMHFSSKMAWPHTTYDVISHDHSNWFSPSLCQNVL